MRLAIPRSLRYVGSRLAELRDQRPEESDVAGGGAVLEPQVQETGGKRAGELSVHPVQQRDEAGRGDERFDELLMIVEMLAQLFEGGAREVQERTPVDVGVSNGGWYPTMA